jgi:hypothetical protein
MVNSCITLTTTKKNQLSVSDYYAKMSHFDNELAASDNPLHDDELFAYLLASLDKDFNLVFMAMVARVDPITLSELYAQLLSFEHHTNLQAHNSWGGGGEGASSAMATSHGRDSSGGGGYGGSTRGSARGRGCDHGPYGDFSNQFTKSTGTNNGSSSHP